MNVRAAPTWGAVLGLALGGAGSSHALSLRSSAAETFLGDVSPGATVVFSRAAGARLRVENAGLDPARIEFAVVSPPPSALKDGFEPWPYPDRARLSVSRGQAKPGAAVETDLTVKAPEDPALIGGLYEIDVVATGYDRAGASLKVKSRVFLSIGGPPPSADPPPGGFAVRPGFELSPPSATIAEKPGRREDDDPGGGATLKLVNAGDEDLTATLSPVRIWDDDARISDGYEPAPNPRWLRLEPATLTVRAGSIARARAWADVPKQARYAGRRMAFVAAVDAVSKGRRTRRYFVLHVNVGPLEETGRAP
jgi:hypothetical protein